MKHTKNYAAQTMLCTLLALLMALVMLTGCAIDIEKPFLGLLAPDLTQGAENNESGENGETNNGANDKGALYTEDTELGEGATTVLFRVTADDLSVLFTIHTDKTVLGDALTENGLVEGESGAYGLYVKRVNGILADYDVDGSWWCLYVDGEMAMGGVDTTEIVDGISYEFKKEK